MAYSFHGKRKEASFGRYPEVSLAQAGGECEGARHTGTGDTGDVSPRGVIEHLDVVEDIGARIAVSCIHLAADTLALEQLEETLYYGVVVAIAPAARASEQVVRTQEHLLLVPSELTTLEQYRNLRQDHSNWWRFRSVLSMRRGGRRCVAPRGAPARAGRVCDPS